MLRSIKSISNTYLILDKEKFIEYSIKNKDKYFLIHFRENEYLISPWNSKKLISEYIDDIQKVRPTKEVEKPKPVRKRSPRKKE
jgi:predicted Ser/Thr protein kinase